MALSSLGVNKLRSSLTMLGITIDVDAQGAIELDIQPLRKSDKPKAEPATAD